MLLINHFILPLINNQSISRQTEYKERRLLPAQKLKRLFLLQQIMGRLLEQFGN